MHPDVKEILINEEQIAARVKELGAKISQDYQGKEFILVSVLTGAMPFTVDLLRQIQGDVMLDTMIASSYGAETCSCGKVKISKDIKTEIAGKHVLVVDDIIDTGLTLMRLVEQLRERKPASLKTCVFLDKPSRRTVNFKADYCGYEIPDAFAIGYGLDYAEKYRNLPYVGMIKEEAVK